MNDLLKIANALSLKTEGLSRGELLQKIISEVERLEQSSGYYHDTCLNLFAAIDKINAVLHRLGPNVSNGRLWGAVKNVLNDVQR
jgi:hypothetical protein